jgi:O-antigen/teichoic acid export membrane protein
MSPRIRSLARDASWNLLAHLVPLAAALAAVPPLLAALGAARLGILSLFWALVGYFSLFDLGLGRAVTQLVARADDEQGTPGRVRTALALMAALGVAGGALLAALAGPLTRRLLLVPGDLAPEAETAFRVLGLAIPAVTLSSGLRGLLEARGRFRDSALVRCGTGLATFLLPVALLPLRPSLVSVAAALVAARWLGGIAFLPASLRALPGLCTAPLARNEMGALFRFGGWITVSNVLGPLLATADRFFVGAAISLSAVAYYAVPAEIVGRATILPASIVGALFPAFASARDPWEARSLFRRGMGAVLATLSPCALAILFFARPLLAAWVGPEFADHGAPVLRILAFGVLCNGLAYVPSGFVQALGRPDLAAKLHLAEMAPYALAVWLLAGRFGTTGVAAAWTLRVLLDLALLCWCAARLLPGRPREGREALALGPGLRVADG